MHKKIMKKYLYVFRYQGSGKKLSFYQDSILDEDTALFKCGLNKNQHILMQIWDMATQTTVYDRYKTAISPKSKGKQNTGNKQ